MGILKFEDILSWQKSRVLTVNIYKIFNNSPDFAFKNQIQRASVSIMNNIAEGFERKSNKEFKYFLFVAKGSVAEVRSMLYLARDLDTINDELFNELYDQTLEVSKLLSGLINKINVIGDGERFFSV